MASAPRRSARGRRPLAGPRVGLHAIVHFALNHYMREPTLAPPSPREPPPQATALVEHCPQGSDATEAERF